MKTINLTESDCFFTKYILRMYAQQTEGLDQEDVDNIYEIANKFN